MTRAVPAVARALDILELFLARSSLTSSEIAARTGLPRTTIHELATTLTDRGYLLAEPGMPTHYRLGPRLFQLGGRFAGQVDLAREAQATAEAVAAECDETVQVAVLDGDFAVCVAKADSSQSVRVVVAIGNRLPVHACALGQVLLAGASDEVAFEHDEVGNDARGAAAPVRDHTGRIVAALGVSVPATREIAHCVPFVQKGAAELSQRLGYRIESEN